MVKFVVLSCLLGMWTLSEAESPLETQTLSSELVGPGAGLVAAAKNCKLAGFLAPTDCENKGVVGPGKELHSEGLLSEGAVHMEGMGPANSEMRGSVKPDVVALMDPGSKNVVPGPNRGQLVRDMHMLRKPPCEGPQGEKPDGESVHEDSHHGNSPPMLHSLQFEEGEAQRTPPVTPKHDPETFLEAPGLPAVMGQGDGGVGGGGGTDPDVRVPDPAMHLLIQQFIGPDGRLNGQAQALLKSTGLGQDAETSPILKAALAGLVPVVDMLTGKLTPDVKQELLERNWAAEFPEDLLTVAVQRGITIGFPSDLMGDDGVDDDGALELDGFQPPVPFPRHLQSLGAFGNPLGSLGSLGSLGNPLSSLGNPLGSLSSLGNPLGSLSNPLGSLGSLSNPLGSLGSLSNPLGSLGSSLGSFGSPLSGMGTSYTNPLSSLTSPLGNPLGGGLGGLGESSLLNPLALLGNARNTGLGSPFGSGNLLSGMAGPLQLPGLAGLAAAPFTIPVSTAANEIQSLLANLGLPGLP